jgi:hypothetical protein
VHSLKGANSAGWAPEHGAQGGGLAGGAAPPDGAQLPRDVPQLRPQPHLLADVVQHARLQGTQEAVCRALSDTSAARTRNWSCCPVPCAASCKSQVYAGICAVSNVAHVRVSTCADELRHLRRFCCCLEGDVGALHPGAEHRVLPLRVQQPVQREAQPPVARSPVHE